MLLAYTFCHLAMGAFGTKSKNHSHTINTETHQLDMQYSQTLLTSAISMKTRARQYYSAKVFAIKFKPNVNNTNQIPYSESRKLVFIPVCFENFQ